jgi:outer membrane protein OmpA-like peptidoglycan-associated protein
MKNWFKLLAALLLALSVGSAMASKDPRDVDGTEEHPEIIRFPNFFINESKHNDYNEVAFPTKSGEQVKAGKYWWIAYMLKLESRVPSPVEVIKNYENAFKQIGGTQVYRDKSDTAVYRMPLAQGGERWVQLQVTGEGHHYQMTIVETAPMEQKLEFSSDEMAAAIGKNGFVALNGILFDTGKAAIKPESEALIKEIVALLNKDKSLKLSIVGHTDNAGDKKANLALSKQRAESVVRQLVAAGIDARRLKAEGKGDTEPTADNRMEEGRAKNRRVELVKF